MAFLKEIFEKSLKDFLIEQLEMLQEKFVCLFLKKKNSGQILKTYLEKFLKESINYTKSIRISL